jgi:hypothetical protein
VGQEICPVCCGTKRLVEIACPPDCIYLESAYRHPAAAVKRQQERDLAVLMAVLGRVSEGQLQLFFLLHTFISRFKPAALSRIVDGDVADAAGALAASFETSSRGVLYEHHANSVVGEELRRELKTFLAELGRGGGSRFEAQAAAVLRGIERGARHETDGVGSEAQAYLALVARLLNERPPGKDTPSTLILP